ncbi:MAG: hypothetical protein ABI833_07555, partial [Acidobacteriota bacterium]
SIRLLPNGDLDLFRVLQQPGGSLMHLPAHCRERESSGEAEAIEQSGAEFTLQRLNAYRYGRLGTSQLDCRAGEAIRGNNGHECPQVL